MPFDRSQYPADWLDISRKIRVGRAKGFCEWCGAVAGHAHPVTGSVVVLTTAHLGVPHDDGRPGDKNDKLDCREENLAGLCQRCHLNYDREDHIRHARETRRRKFEERTGQMRLVI